jgi:hypothetical protein
VILLSSEEFQKLVLAKLDNIEKDVGGLKITVNENTQILKALEHSSEVNKAEHDKMSNDIAHMKGSIESIRQSLYRVEEATANNWADIARLKQAK